MPGICPSCKKPVTSVRMDEIAVHPAGKTVKRKGVSYACAQCNTVISVELNMRYQANRTAEITANALKG